MKNKFFVGFMIALICLFIFWLLSVGFPRKMGNSYASVQIFNLHSSKEFYDFYAPEYYFDADKPKQTLSDINKIDIWYQGSVNDDYNIVFKGGSFNQDENLEIIYSVSNYNEDEFQKLKKDDELIDDELNIYYCFDENNIEVVHNHDNQELIKIIMTNIHQEKQTLEKMKTIIYEIMKDSIQLNERISQ